MSRPFLELRDGHMVVLQVRVLQVNVSDCSTFCLFAQHLFQYSSWILPFWWSLSLCRSAVSGGLEDLEKPKVQGLRHQWLDHVLLRAVPSSSYMSRAWAGYAKFSL